jgi:hypothetical protein
MPATRRRAAKQEVEIDGGDGSALQRRRRVPDQNRFEPMASQQFGDAGEKGRGVRGRSASR